MSRHDLELSYVTPLIAHRFYKTHGMPLCGVIVEDDEENDILIGACATAVFSNTYYLTHIENVICNCSVFNYT